MFKLEHNHEIAFKAIVKELSRDDCVLKYCNPECNVYLKCDVSRIGAELTLLQKFTVEDKDKMDMFCTSDYLHQLLPIAYGSRKFTQCER